MKVWLCKFDNRPPEVWTESADPIKDILHRDIGNGHLDKDDVVLRTTSFEAEDWCSGELVEVFE